MNWFKRIFCMHKDITWTVQDGQWCCCPDWESGVCNCCGAEFERDLR